MKINKASWHYQLVMKHNRYSPARNLCPYMRQVLWTSIQVSAKYFAIGLGVIAAATSMLWSVFATASGLTLESVSFTWQALWILGAIGWGVAFLIGVMVAFAWWWQNGLEKGTVAVVQTVANTWDETVAEPIRRKSSISSQNRHTRAERKEQRQREAVELKRDYEQQKKERLERGDYYWYELLGNFLVASHDKICPLLEFVEEEDEQEPA